MEILQLRAHHATEIKRRQECQTDPEDLADLMERQGYDFQTIMVVLNILQKTSNPEQVIQILPNEDLTNDPICQNCVSMRNKKNCDKPLLFGRIGKDCFEALRFGLTEGEQLTVEELKNKEPAFGPHFKI